MTGPDLGAVNLWWGGELLCLRYPLGAVKTLAEKLGVSVEIDELPKLHGRINLDTLPTWVWAGLLHETQGKSPRDLEEVTHFIAWGQSPLYPLIAAVGKAYTSGIFGTLPEPKESDSPKEVTTPGSVGRGQRLVTLLSSFFLWMPRHSGGNGTSSLSSSISRQSVGGK